MEKPATWPALFTARPLPYVKSGRLPRNWNPVLGDHRNAPLLYVPVTSPRSFTSYAVAFPLGAMSIMPPSLVCMNAWVVRAPPGVGDEPIETPDSLMAQLSLEPSRIPSASGTPSVQRSACSAPPGAQPSPTTTPTSLMPRASVYV